MLTLMTMNSGKTVACHGKLRKFLGLSQDEAKNLFDSIKDGNPYTVSGLSDKAYEKGLKLRHMEAEFQDLGCQVMTQGEDEGIRDIIVQEPIETVPTPRESSGDAEQLASIIQKMAGGAVDADSVRQIVKAEIAKLDTVTRQVITVEYKTPDAVTKIETAHPKLETALKLAMTGQHPLMVGSAGTGKTTIGEHVAKALDRPFYFTGAVQGDYKLNGYMDANGNYVRTAFRDAYEKGGVFLFDEIDASHPSAIVAFNSALANGHHDFPDGIVKRHENFVCLASANTYGRGADRIYAGRNQLDGASLDRFTVVEVDYDTRLEFLLGESNPAWVENVHKIRRAIERTGTKHICGTRAVINGIKCLNAGFTQEETEDMVIWKGLSPDIIRKVKAEM